MQRPKIRITIRNDEIVEILFKINIENNNIPGAEQGINSVFLMIKIKGENNFQQIPMQKKGLQNIYHHNMKISKKEEYQYHYKVNSEREKDYRYYKYDPNLENGVDEWNKIWIGYCLNYDKEVIEQQLDLGNEIFKQRKQIKCSFIQNTKLVEDLNMLRVYETQLKNDLMDENNQQIKGRLVLISNHLIFDFSEDFIYNYHQNIQKVLNEQIKQQQQKLSFTNKFIKAIEIIQIDSNQTSNELIENLLQQIKIPLINQDSTFDKCKQSIITINSKLQDLKQNQSRIQDQYESLKIACDGQLQHFHNLQNNSNESTLSDSRDDLFQKQDEFYLNPFYRYINVLYSILQELTSDTNQISNEQIENLLTPLNLSIIKNPIFEKCQQCLIIINNKLKDLKQNEKRIQNQFCDLKIVYEQERQSSQNQHQNSILQNHNQDQNSYMQQDKEIQFLRYKLQQTLINYTKNMNNILEQLIQETNYISGQQIENLLTPIEIPQMIKDPKFEKCKQSQIIINSRVEEKILKIKINHKLKDLKQNKLKIQEQYDNFKIDQAIQELSDYEYKIQKNDKYYQIIKKFKQELNEKLQKIEKLKKEQNYAQIQFKNKILEIKKKYQEDIQQLQQEHIGLIEQQRDQTIKLNLDTNRKIQLLENDQARLKNLIREKDSLVKSQSDYVTTLLKQIQNQKEWLKLKD